MYDLTRFTLGDMTACGAALRKAGAGARSMEETAGRMVRHLYEGLRGPGADAPACPLVRFFKTHAADDLDADLRAWARRALGREPPPGLKCLLLLATAGDRPEWNSRLTSARHRAVPLAGPEALRQLPMIAQLLGQFGLDPQALLRLDPGLLVDVEQKTYNVFHVPQAHGSEFVPDQEGFVVPYGIRSVLGFGGVLPGRDLFALVLFSRVVIPRETADLFRPLALTAKLALLSFAHGPVFRDPGPEVRGQKSEVTRQEAEGGGPGASAGPPGTERWLQTSAL
jgi:hypothetical protein